MDEQRNCHTHTHTHTNTEILLGHQKERNLAIDNMVGSQGCYAKQNKPDRQKQILYGISYRWKLKTKTKPKDTEKK